MKICLSVLPDMLSVSNVQNYDDDDDEYDSDILAECFHGNNQNG